MGHIRKLVRRPVIATLVLGVLNALNLCKSMWRPGCTGREIPEMLFVAIPFASGLASAEAPWFSALVMIIPAVMLSDALLEGREALIECGTLYLGYFGLVLLGTSARKVLVIPLIVRLQSMKSRVTISAECS